MNANEIYKNLGITLIVFIAIGVVLKGFNYQKKIVEGLTNKSPTGDALITSTLAIMEKMVTAEETAAEKSDDVLSTEDFLADFEELISAEIIFALRVTSDDILKMTIPTKLNSYKDSDESKAAWLIIDRINDLNKFRETLADASKSWDDMKGNVSSNSKKDSSSSSSSSSSFWSK
jgi:hypothetical protein